MSDTSDDIQIYSHATVSKHDKTLMFPNTHLYTSILGGVGPKNSQL